MSEEKKILLDVKDLVIRYETDDGIVEALNGVSIQIEEGKTLGLVGETGAGKTTLARGIMRLIQSPPGKIVSGEVSVSYTHLSIKDKQHMGKKAANRQKAIARDRSNKVNDYTNKTARKIINLYMLEAKWTHL